MNPLPLVAAELRTSRARTAAVIALVAVAVGLGVAVSCQERALRSGSARAAAAFDLIVGARGSATQLVLSTVYLQPALLDLIPGRVLEALTSDPGVERAAPLVFGDSYRGAPVVGSTADLVTRGGRVALAEGRAFASEREAIVGADVPLAVGARFAAAHGQGRGATDHDGFEYAVVGRAGRLGSPWDRAIVVPVEALWRVHARPREGGAIGPPWSGELPDVSAVVVTPRSIADAYRLRARYRAEPTTAVFPAEVLVELYGFLGDARDGLAVVAGVAEGLVAVAVLLAASAALAHRRRALGVLRALGASRLYVFAVAWLNVAILLVTGAALGLVLGWVGAALLSAAFEARTGVAVRAAISGREIAMVAALAGIGAALALIPAWRCYREPIAPALRS